MRGGDMVGLRAYNERLVVDSILKAGALSKAEIARATGLSGQAASVIVNRLLRAGLVEKGEKIRGNVGQPSTPIGANPRGAFSIGVKIGRRSVEAMLVDMVGDVVVQQVARHDAPLPGPTIDTACRLVSRLLAALEEPLRHRVVGIGVALPGMLEAWSSELGLEPDALAGWKDLDPGTILAEATGLDVAVYNDATAACAAEMMRGEGVTAESALYIYLGTFIGAGVVLEGKLFRGGQSNAGSIASMPGTRLTDDGKPEQLIRSASLITLEWMLEEAGSSLPEVLDRGASQRETAIFEAWMEWVVPEVARAVVCALSVIDFEVVVVDGQISRPWRRAFRSRLSAELRSFDMRGLLAPDIATGSIGASARVYGAALLPLKARFSPDPNLLVGRRTAAEEAGASDATTLHQGPLL